MEYLKINGFCPECGHKLIEKELEHEGIIPFCENCNKYVFPKFNVAVSCVIFYENTDKIILVKQYGRDFYILVAGYVNLGETAESAVVREIKEELGLTVDSYSFNKTSYFEKSNTLILNYTVHASGKISPNYEIDSFSLFTKDEALNNIKASSLAKEFLTYALTNK
ncbi:MAG: NUDIX domain-containing protein [Clostridia bacterium]|nr:NUDIX domain-containing protein [Clostridia bacterium]